MLPEVLFSELSGTVNGYVNFPRGLYHLLAMGRTPWLLHCCSFRDRGREFQQANGVQGVRAQSLWVRGTQAGGDGMLPCYCARKPVRQNPHRDEKGFSEWKRQWGY